MLQFAQSVIESIGYLGIGLLVFIENVFPPIPSEVVIPFSGFAARRGDLNLVGVIIAGTLGSTLGAFPLYYLGYRLTEERIMQLADKYGEWFRVSGEDIQRADTWLRDRGRVAVFICRLIPGLRSIISIPAGLARMPLSMFTLYTFAGTAIWTTILAVLGFILGESYTRIQPYIDRLGWIAFIVLFAAFAYWVYRRRQNQNQDDTGSTSRSTDSP